MFGKKKEPAVYDVTHKRAKTWWGGTKQVPTSKTEQRKLKAELLARDPCCVVIDDAAKKKYEKQHALDWIDRLEELDAILDD